MVSFALLLAILLGSDPVVAQVKPESGSSDPCQSAQTALPRTVTLGHENDFFGRTDRDYTSGTIISMRYSRVEALAGKDCPLGLAGTVARWMNQWPAAPLTERDFVFSMGQQLYTPRDYRASGIVVRERPYAAWLFSRWAIHANDSVRSQTLAIDLGLIGPAAGGESSQNFFHKLEGYPRFQGWNNQLRNELGLQLSGEWRSLIARTRNSRLNGHYGIGIGNVETYLNAGLQWKLGQTLVDNHVLPASMRPATAVRSAALTQSSQSPQWFAGFDARLVGRNIFLDGNTWATSHSVTRKPLVAELSTGLVWNWAGADLALTFNLRSREYEGQSYKHFFGGGSISVALD